MRIELRDGQWAELRERINHGTDKDLRRAFRVGQEERVKALDFETLVVRSFVRDWYVKDPDGGVIALDDDDAIDRAPDDIIDKLVPLAYEVWTGVKIPTPTPPSSDD
jgi:hypothetical protein